MVEARLEKAANEMPLPQRDFSAVSAQSQKKTAGKGRLRPALIVLAAVILLCGCSAAVTEVRKATSGQVLLRSHAWVDAKARAEKYGFSISETYGDYTFDTATVCVMVPGDLPWALGLFYPGHRVMNVSYRNPADGTVIKTAFTGTDDEIWMYCFGYEGEDLWAASGDYEAVEYGGMTIHTGKNSVGYQVATWVDAEKGACFKIAANGTDPLPMAQEIIDLSGE